MNRDEMWHAACQRFESLACKYADKNVTDRQFFEELCCSIYAGDELKEAKPKLTIKLDEDCRFEYKGYCFELTPCTMLTSRQEVLNVAKEFLYSRTKGIFTDRYVCWMTGHRDDNGYTKEEYLKLYPNETVKKNTFAPKLYLVPGAWAYGAEFDCNPGDLVIDIILEYIDEFLEQNPNL